MTYLLTKIDPVKIHKEVLNNFQDKEADKIHVLAKKWSNNYMPII